MPKKKPLPRATNKEDRQYEDIKKSYLKKGKPLKTSKRIAAMTVEKERTKNKMLDTEFS